MNVAHQILGYDVLGTLGHGAKSTIFAVRDSSGQVFALKRVVREGPSDDRFLDQAISEHEVARKFDHPSLRKSFKLIRQRAIIRTSEVYVLMELVDGKTTEQHKVRDITELCAIGRQTADALHAMHLAGFVHCDIKPNNIMITEEGLVKVIDFGQSCPIGTVKERIQGTPDYIAPEQVKRRRLTAATDVFNLGATLYWLTTGKHVPTLMPKKDPGRPKAGQVVTEEMDLTPRRKADPPRDLNPDVPPALSSLIMNCVEYDPDDRPSDMLIVRERLDMSLAQLERERRLADRATRSGTNANRRVV